MKLKVGDRVKIIAGKDKGKEGKITQTISKFNKVIVEGLNMVKRHTKPDGHGNPGGIITREAPVDASNIKLIDSKKETKAESKKETKKAKKPRSSKKKLD